MHVRDAAGSFAEQVPQEPAQGLVLQSGERDDRGRSPGDFSSETPAARATRDDRVRLHADLCLSRLSGTAAHQPDRYRAVQVRRAEAERVAQAREEPRLLEEG